MPKEKCRVDHDAVSLYALRVTAPRYPFREGHGRDCDEPQLQQHASLAQKEEGRRGEYVKPSRVSGYSG